MTSKTNCKQAGIILMITSFNQIYNFLSYFNQNKLMKNTKVYLTIFSDHIPDKLILEFKEYIEDFAKVEILDLRRKSLITYKLKIRFLRIIFYYFFILKKIILLKKTSVISNILVSGRMQIAVLCFLNYFSKSKIFLIEDGIGEYVPYHQSEKKPVLFFLFKRFCKKNTSRIFVLQLAKDKSCYSRLLNQYYLKKENYCENIELYINFLKNISKEKYLFKPKCLMIGTVPSVHNNLEHLKNLYIKTLTEINQKYFYSSDQILFLPHPRTQITDYEKLTKILSKYSTVHEPSSIIVENYLLQENIELIVGGLSSSLFYAKTIFEKKRVFYIDHKSLLLDSEKNQNFIKTFEKVGIKNFFNYY